MNTVGKVKVEMADSRATSLKVTCDGVVLPVVSFELKVGAWDVRRGYATVVAELLLDELKIDGQVVGVLQGHAL